MINLYFNQVFCDTSFFYASIDENDIDHARAEEILTYCTDKNIRFFTTWDIISETVTLLRYRYSYKGAIRFLDEIKPDLEIIPVDSAVRNEAELIFKKFSRDKKLSFCDCISYVIVTKVLNYIPCLSFDEDFKSLGLIVT